MLRELMAASLDQCRTGLTAGLLGIPEDTVAGPAELALGSVQLALMSGVLVQWLIDPGRAPDERMIADGVLGLAAHITGAPEQSLAEWARRRPEHVPAERGTRARPGR